MPIKPFNRFMPKAGQKVQLLGEDRYFEIVRVDGFGDVFYDWVPVGDNHAFHHKTRKWVLYDKLEYDVRLGLWKQVEK